MTPLIGIMLAAAGLALANKVLKGNVWPSRSSMKSGGESTGKVLEIDDYEILE